MLRHCQHHQRPAPNWITTAVAENAQLRLGACHQWLTSHLRLLIGHNRQLGDMVLGLVICRNETGQWWLGNMCFHT